MTVEEEVNVERKVLEEREEGGTIGKRREGETGREIGWRRRNERRKCCRRGESGKKQEER